MVDKSTILMRRMGVKAEIVSKGGFGGFLGGKETHVLLDGGLSPEEKLCLVSNDGNKAEVIAAEDVPVLYRQKQELAAGDMLFAVFCPPFNFHMSIAAGEDADGYSWFFDVGGMLEILKPAAFARTFRGVVGKDAPLAAAAFEEMLGTMPATILHDKVLVDVLGVMSLGEKDGEDQYVDMRKRLNQEKGVGEKYVASAVSGTFDEFFGEEKVVAMKVTSFHAHSPECEKEIARRIEAEVERVKYVRKKEEADRLAQEEAASRQKELEDEIHQTNLERERIERNRLQEQEKIDAEKRKREEKLAAMKIDVEMAELQAQKKKLEGGGVESAFEAFETLANVLGNTVAGNGGGTFAGLLQEARRTEAGLKVLAVSKDRKKRSGGVKLLKNTRTYGTRAIGTRGFILTPTLKYGEALSSTIVSERKNGYLTVLNVSEKNEIVPMLPNENFPDVRIANGERLLIGDDKSDLIREIHEGAQSGTDHLVAIISDQPLLDGPLPTFGEALSPAEANRFATKLASLDDAEWSADVMSFKIFP